MSKTNKKSNVVQKKPIKKITSKATKTTNSNKLRKNLTSKDVMNISNSQIIYLNSNKSLPKRIEFVGYSCIRRYYKVIESSTGKEKLVRMWIVIGDGHKRYRKFETQAEAINYFRNIQKYAFMRIQSINSTKFTKTIYTIFELKWRGINTNELSKGTTTKEVIYLDDDKDYEDQFSQYDEFNSKEYESFDYSSIDAVIVENEGAIYDTEEAALISQAKQENLNVFEKKDVVELPSKEEISIILEEQNNNEESIIVEQDNTFEYKSMDKEKEFLKEEIVLLRDEKTNFKNVVFEDKIEIPEKEEVIFFREKPMDIVFEEVEETKADNRILVEEVSESSTSKTIVYVEELNKMLVSNEPNSNHCYCLKKAICCMDKKLLSCNCIVDECENTIKEENVKSTEKNIETDNTFIILEDKDDEFFEKVKSVPRTAFANMFYWIILIVVLASFIAVAGLSIWLAL